MPFAHVNQIILECRLIVDQNVILARNVHKIKHVKIKNVSILVQAHVVKMLYVK